MRARPQAGEAVMPELTNEATHVGEEDQAASCKQRTQELPPAKLDVIYIGGFPPVWQIWRRKGGMVTIQVEPQESLLQQ